jgi:hypothetical protein
MLEKERTTALVQKFGTKLGYMIYHLQQLLNKDKNNRVIIFSQVHHKQTIQPPFP